MVLAVSVLLFSCSKSKNDASSPSTTETYLKFTIDGMNFSFDGSVRCSIEYTFYDDNRQWHVFRFAASQGDQFFNAWTNTATSNQLTLGDYKESTTQESVSGFDWKLNGIQSAKGEIVCSVTNIKDNKYYSGTISGSISYVNTNGQTKQTTISNGEFKNLELK